MGPFCFRKKNSDPPVCGEHDVLLVQRQSFDDPTTLYFGEFSFFVCPVSGNVLPDDPDESVYSVPRPSK
jgi:hypothetical protein